MSKFLRDRYLKTLTLSQSRLSAVHDILVNIANNQNQDLQPGDPKLISVKYVVRFDNKGYVLDDFDLALDFHMNSKSTERFNFILQSEENRATNGMNGKLVDLRFDSLNDSNCTLAVQDDDQNWADAVFCRLDEEIQKFKNMNFVFRTGWTPFMVQILGVLAGFSLSLWTALRVAPELSIQYAFVVSFVLAFLIFSNIWMYLNQQILFALNRLFPNITFDKDRGFKWLGQTFVGAIFVAIAFYVFDVALRFLADLVSEILK